MGVWWLVSVQQDVIPRVISSQKCHMNTGPILIGYRATDIWSIWWFELYVEHQDHSCILDNREYNYRWTVQSNKWKLVEFQVLKVASMKMTAVWDVAVCSQVEVDRHFRAAYCHHHQCRRQYAPLKHWSTSARLYGATSQIAVIF
jgi:hypothetical protein